MLLKSVGLFLGILSFIPSNSQSIKDFENLIIGKQSDSVKILLTSWLYTLSNTEQKVKNDSTIETITYIKNSSDQYVSATLVLLSTHVREVKFPVTGIVYATFSEKKFNELWNECLLIEGLQFVKEDFEKNQQYFYYKTKVFEYILTKVDRKHKELDPLYYLHIALLE